MQGDEGSADYCEGQDNNETWRSVHRRSNHAESSREGNTKQNSADRAEVPVEASSRQAYQMVTGLLNMSL